MHTANKPRVVGLWRALPIQTMGMGVRDFLRWIEITILAVRLPGQATMARGPVPTSHQATYDPISKGVR